METFLRNNYTAYFGEPVANVVNISQQTNAVYFEIEDDQNRETTIHYLPNTGTAVYNNPRLLNVIVINYDKFVTSLSHNFQQGRKRCDLIVITAENKDYFLLNELKDANPNSGLIKATSQLERSIQDIMAVPIINAYAATFTVKRCCFFNKRVVAPPIINAVNAFGLVNAINLDGFQMVNLNIEQYGFKLWEYSGGQKFTL